MEEPVKEVKDREAVWIDEERKVQERAGAD